MTQELPPLATTAAGVVRGAIKDGVAVWRGVPYAAAPVGAGRFRPPQPVAPWRGERDATRRGPVAMQARDPRTAMMAGIGAHTAMSEDCLGLDIYAPADPEARAAGGRPVVVWIHGGAFILGAGSQPLYDGAPFVRGGAIVVSINYRLGVFGLLFLGDLAPGYDAGNVALLDQLAALRWVRDNIAAFGGDPAQLAVMGESAGAVSIASLLGMPAARGAFDRAILQSGAAALVPTSRADATALARELVKGLGVDPDALAEVPAERLIAAQGELSRRHGLGAFLPYVDGATLPRDPAVAVREGAAAGVPLLLGSNRDEWALFDTLFGAPATSAVRALVERRLGPVVTEVVAAYRAAHAGDDARAWVDLIGDVVFRLPALRLAEAQLAHAPVWVYRFDIASTAFGGRLGATHALELPFVWAQLDQPFSQLLLGDARDTGRALGAQLHATWAQFIATGAPAGVTSGGGLPPWPAYELPRRATMVLDTTPHVEDDAGGVLRAAWPAEF